MENFSYLNWIQMFDEYLIKDYYDADYHHNMRKENYEARKCGNCHFI